MKAPAEPAGTAVVVETDIERKKREADELLKGLIPDDVIDGSAGIICFLILVVALSNCFIHKKREYEKL